MPEEHQHLWLDPEGDVWGVDPEGADFELTCSRCGALHEADGTITFPHSKEKSMRSYVGPLLDSLAPDISLSAECRSDWMHSAAIHTVIVAICLGSRVTLTRRKLTPSRDEIPGAVEGRCYGASHERGGRILLALQLDSGESIGVDVSNPQDWSWEVSHD